MTGNSTDNFIIKRDALDGPEMEALIADHAALMLSQSPSGSCHFLPIDGLRVPDVTVWSMWRGADLLGCGGLKQLGAAGGEIKSMHTREAARGQGLGQIMLDHIVGKAQAANMPALYLETGSMDGFIPARRLYEKNGFAYCGPFGDYVEDPNSVYMWREV